MSLKDIAEAARRFRRIGMLALGAIVIGPAIAINVILFNISDGFLFRSLPYGNSEELLRLAQFDPASGNLYQTVASGEIAAIREGGAGVTAFNDSGMPRSIARPGGSVRTLTAQVDSNFFATMELALEGRGLGPADAGEAQPPVVISKVTWVRLFGEEEFEPNKSVSFDDGTRGRIVGRLRADFVFPDLGGAYQPDFIQLLEAQPSARARVFGIARKPASVSPNSFQDLIDRMVSGAHAAWPELAGTEVRAISLSADLLGSYQPTLRGMLVTATLVLLAAAATLGILFGERVLQRQHEYRLRVALGATRRQLLETVLIEVLFFSIAAGAAGLLAAYWWLGAYIKKLPGQVYPLFAGTIDGRTVTASLVFIVGLAAVASVTPLFYLNRADLSMAPMHAVGRLTRHKSQYRQWLLAFQIGIGVAIGLATARVVATVVDFETTRLGFDPRGAFTFVATDSTASPEQRFLFHQRVMKTLRGVAGIAAVGSSRSLPLSGLAPEWRLDDRTSVPGAELWRATSGFFAASGIRILRGREFTDADVDQPVAIVTSRFARTAWAGTEALGKVLELPSMGRSLAVIGVADDTRRTFLAEPVAAVYLPSSPASFRASPVIVRTALSRRDTETRIRTALSELTDTSQIRIVSASDAVSGALSVQRFQASVSLVWTCLVVGLTAFGSFVISVRTVSAQWRDLGIRLALGATRIQLGLGLLAYLFFPVMAGCVAGVATAHWSGSLLESMMRGIVPTSPWFEATVCLGVAGVVLAVAGMGLLRLRRLEPGLVLRS